MPELTHVDAVRSKPRPLKTIGLSFLAISIPVLPLMAVGSLFDAAAALAVAAIAAVLGAGIYHGGKQKIAVRLVIASAVVCLIPYAVDTWATIKWAWAQSGGEAVIPQPDFSATANWGIYFVVTGMCSMLTLFALVGLWGWLSYFNKSAACEDVSCPN